MNISHTTNKSKRLIILSGLWLIYFGYYFCRKNIGIANTTLQRTFGFSESDYAQIITIYSIIYMLGQFINGYLSDKFGPKIIMGLGIILSVTANFFLGLSFSLLMFTVLSGFNGYGQSTGWSGSIKILSLYFNEKDRGVITGWWTTSYVIGGFGASIFATYWLTQSSILPSYSWQKVFWAPSLFLLMLAILFFIVIPNEKATKDQNLLTNKTINTKKDTKGYLLLLSLPEIWLVGISYFFLKFIRYSFLFWLPAYLEQSLNYTAANAGYLSSIYELAGFGGILVAGYLSDRVFGLKRFAVSSLMLFLLSAGFLFQFLFSDHSFIWVCIMIFISGFATYGPDSLLSGAIAIDIGSHQDSAKASGFINGMGSAGQLLSPIAVAIICQKMGWDYLFRTFFYLSIISAVLMLSKWKHNVNKNVNPLNI